MVYEKGLRKKTTALTICVVSLVLMLIFAFVHESAVSANAAAGIGTISSESTWNIASGAVYKQISSTNSSGAQKIYMVEYDPYDEHGIRPIVTHGPYAKGKHTLSQFMQAETDNGYSVVAGLNGDRYETLAYGITIRDGKLLKGGRDPRAPALAFYEDGTAVLGYPRTTLYAASNTLGSWFEIERFNEGIWDGASAWGAKLLTEDYSTQSDQTNESTVAVLTLNEGSRDGFKIGGSVEATVKSVGIPKGSTPINKNEIILSAAPAAGSYFSKINSLSVGELVTIYTTVDDMDTSAGTVDWTKVYQAIGADGFVVKNGVAVTDPALSHSPGVNPRTAVGIMPDGKIILFAADGRQTGVAAGVSFAQIGQYMAERGAKHVVTFDGGGSTTIAARLPGEDTAKIRNKPSDGSERANINGMVFVSKLDASNPGDPDSLQLYIDGHEDSVGSTKVLENTKLSLSAKALDANYFPITEFGEVTFSVQGNIGSISGKTFTAGTTAASGKIIATLNSDTSVKGELNIEIVNSLNEITATTTIISLPPSGTKQLEFLAYNNGLKVICSNESLTFSLSPSSLGTISKSGLFTALDAKGAGELTVSYKSTTFKIPVEIGKLPEDITGFEGESFEDIGWGWTYVSPSNGGSGSMSLNKDPEFVKYGDSSLRIDYDFQTNPPSGTISIEGNVNRTGSGGPGSYTTSGIPTAIGCWVYGDGNGGWFRIQASGTNNYIGNEAITWTGWKYIETPIPAALQGAPVTIVRSVRLVQTASGYARGKKGTIYVDGIRAVYDFKNDDRTDPVVTVTPTPISTSNWQPEIKLTIADLPGNSPDINKGELNPPFTGEPVYTGINTERTRFWVNNVETSNIIQRVNADGSVDITHVPSSVMTRDEHSCKIRFEDNYGNITFYEWSFTITDPIVYDITIPSGTGYQITGSTSAIETSDMEYEITLETGYEIHYVRANGEDVEVVNGKFSIINIIEDIEITVSVGLINYDITIPTGIGYTIIGDASAQYGSNKQYTLELATGYELKSLKANDVDVPVNDGMFSLQNIREDILITITVSLKNYNITIPSGDGFVLNGDATAAHGSDKEFVLTINDGYEFDYVMVNGSKVTLTDGRFTVRGITQSITIVISVNILYYDISLSSGMGYSLTGDTSAAHGSDKTFSLIIEEGYELLYVKVNNVETPVSGETFSLENITSDLVIEVSVKIDETYLSITIPSGIGYFIVGDSIAAPNSNKEYTITIETGYQLNFVKVNGSTVMVVDGRFEIENIEEDIVIEVSVTIEDTYCSVTIPKGTGYTIQGDATVVKGSDNEYTITINVGYELMYVKANGVDVAISDGSFTLIAVVEDIVITVGVGIITYDITIPTGTGFLITGSTTAEHGSEKEFSLALDAGYYIEYLRVNGTDTSVMDDKFKVRNITEDIIISISVQLLRFDISIPSGEGYLIFGSSSVQYGSNREYTVTIDTGYRLECLKVNGEDVSLTGNTFRIEHITKNITITISVQLIQFDISIPSGTGFTLTGDAVADYGSTKEYTLTIVTGYRLEYLKVNGHDVSLTNDTIRIETITENITITISVQLIQFDISVPSGTGFTLTGDAVADYGSTKEYTLTIAIGYELEYLRVNGNSASLTENKLQIVNITEDIYITISVRLMQFNVMLPTDDGYTLTGDAVAEYGSTKEYSFQLSSGFVLDFIKVDGVEVMLSDGRFQIDNIVQDVQVSVSVSRYYTITIPAGIGFSISGDTSAAHGASAEFLIELDDGYALGSLQANGESIAVEDGKFELTNISEDIVITISVDSVYYTITIPTGSGYKISGGTMAIHGSTREYTITLDEGYTLDYVKVNGVGVSVVNGKFSLKDIAEDCTIEVSVSEAATAVGCGGFAFDGSDSIFRLLAFMLTVAIATFMFALKKEKNLI